MTPQLSIIVPVYNTEKYLDGCIQSILTQTFQDWELILIDDGSTDGSGKICDQYANRDVRIYTKHTVNRGLSSARNTGLDLAKGEYISFIDSDDEITSETYSDNFKILQKYPELKVVQFPTIEGYSEEGGILSLFPKKYYSSNKEIQIAFLEHLPQVTGSVCNKIFSKDIFNTLRFKEGHLHEDYSFIDELVQIIDNFYISEYGRYRYYYRCSSITHTNDIARHIDLLLCDISRLERRYDFSELHHLLLEQYIFVIKEWQNIHHVFPNHDLTKYYNRIKQLRPPIKSVFRHSSLKEKALFLIISVIGHDNFTNIYQRLLSRGKQ